MASEKDAKKPEAKGNISDLPIGEGAAEQAIGGIQRAEILVSNMTRTAEAAKMLELTKTVELAKEVAKPSLARLTAEPTAPKLP